jgi:SAM-dependent methyltransferase
MTGPSWTGYLEAEGRRWNYWTAARSHFQAASDYVRYQILLGLLPARCKRVVDVGCGDGYLDFLLERRGHTAIAVDLSASRLAKARQGVAGELRIVQASCYALPLAAQSCDAVVYSEVLEHLDAPDEALAGAYPVLRPGGRLLLSVPHSQDAPDVVCPHCCRQFNAAGHLRHFEPLQLRALVEAAGFRVERIFTGASALTRYIVRRLTWLSAAAPALDWILRRLSPADNLHLFVVAVRPEEATP